MKNKRLLGLVGSICLLLVLAALPFMGACAPEEGIPPAPVKDTLVVGVIELPPTIDFAEGFTQIMIFFVEATWGKLLSMTLVPSSVPGADSIVDFHTVQPELAESYEFSPDHRTITFHLRKGVLSPWGNEMTAHDVYWKWERGFAMHGLSEYLAGTMDMPADVSCMKIIDDYTISFTSDTPCPISEFVHCTFMTGVTDSTQAKKYITDDDPWAADYVSKYLPGYGPYYVTEWTPGVQAVLEVNPNYWRGEPEIKKIIVKVIPETSSQVAMLKDGTIDLALELSPREVASLRDAPGVKTVETESMLMVQLVMNGEVVPQFKDKRIRQAVNYAIDRDKIIDMAYYGIGKPLYAPVPLVEPWALGPEEFPYYYDIEKAKQLMAESSCPEGFDVEFYYQSGVAAHETLAVILQEDLAKIGINITLRKTPLGALNTLFHSRECPMGVFSDAPLCVGASYASGHFYITGSFPNFGAFSDPDVDAAVAGGRAIMEEEEQWDYYRDVQRLVLERAPIGFVVSDSYRVAMRDNIEGWAIGLMNVWRPQELYFAK
jgi:peptide/nickel transport system substrate-binding protein